MVCDESFHCKINEVNIYIYILEHLHLKVKKNRFGIFFF